MLQSMGSQRVRHNLVTEQQCSKAYYFCLFFLKNSRPVGYDKTTPSRSGGWGGGASAIAHSKPHPAALWAPREDKAVFSEGGNRS